MGHNKKKLRIITNHQEVLQRSIDKFNSIYKTDYRFVEFVRDEVNYAIVEYENSSDDLIFYFGYQFGELIMHLRNKGEIID